MLFFLVGLIPGLIGGVLGIGGGILIVPALYFIFKLSLIEATSLSIFSIVFATIGGSLKNFKLGNIDFIKLIPLIVSGAISTLIFSLLYQTLASNHNLLKLILGITLFLTAIYTIFDIFLNNEKIGTKRYIKTKMILLGILSGLMPGLMGLGGGIVMVPGLTYILGFSIKIAAASSLFVYMFNAIISAGIKLSQGYINLSIAAPICIGSFLGAYSGASISTKIPSKIIKILFSSLLFYISIKFMLNSQL